MGEIHSRMGTAESSKRAGCEMLAPNCTKLYKIVRNCTRLYNIAQSVCVIIILSKYAKAPDRDWLGAFCVSCIVPADRLPLGITGCPLNTTSMGRWMQTLIHRLWHVFEKYKYTLSESKAGADDTLVIVCSDQGAQPTESSKDGYTDLFHRPFGCGKVCGACPE